MHFQQGKLKKYHVGLHIPVNILPVSYTHLDVYKRQGILVAFLFILYHNFTQILSEKAEECLILQDILGGFWRL